MDTFAAVELSRTALWQCLLIGGPLLGVLLLTGIGLAVFQTVTNIHDISLSFVPKLIVLTVVVIWGMPWLMSALSEYSRQAFSEVPRAHQAPGTAP